MTRDRTTLLGLRHTLWHYLLRNVMVFETSQHILRFRDELRARGRVMPPWLKLHSLDGDSYNKMPGLEERSSRAYNVRGRREARVTVSSKA